MKGFTIYKEYYDLITLLSEEEQKDLLLAIMRYMFDNEKPSLNDRQTKIFNNLKRPLDKSKAKSKNGSITNQNKIKTKSKQNQNEIKTKTHQDVNVSNYDSNYVVNVNVNGNVKDNYGEFKNVKLTKEEYEKLEKNNLLPYIEKLSSYIASKGKKYKSHYATILNWSRKETKTENVPEWFDKKIENKVTEEDEQTMQELLKEFE